MSDTRPIGVFDSGIGGVSVLREIARRLPAENLVYFADSANVPYGNRPQEEIERLSLAAAAFLLRQGAKLIVVACNTASAAALTALRAAYPIPFVGMVPAVKPAVARSQTRKVGVLATAGTFRGRLYADVVERFADGAEVHTQVGQGLVELVEAGNIEGPVAEAAVARYVDPLLDAGVDTLVLGCTHYPFLAPTIERVSGGRLVIVEPSPAIAAQVERVLSEGGLLRPSGTEGTRYYFTSGDPAHFAAVLARLVKDSGETRGVRWEKDGWQVD
ncbi:MAG: glutamate racemase [Anaerolineae bacterium]